MDSTSIPSSFLTYYVFVLQGHYNVNVARTGNITPIPPLIAKLRNESNRRFLEDLRNFRSDK